MFRNILALAIGMAIGAGGAQAAATLPAPQAPPSIGAEVTQASHRHARGHDRRGYHRGYHHPRPRYRGRGHYRPPFGDQRGHYRGLRHGYRGHAPVSRLHDGYRRGYDARQNYLRDRYGK